MALESMDHEVVAAASGAEAYRELKSSAFDVVFLDLKLHQENGLAVLEEILRLAPGSAVVVITAFASVETAVEAMRRGAFDYLPKPCTPDQVRQLLLRIDTRDLQAKADTALGAVQNAQAQVSVAQASVASAKTAGIKAD